MGAWWRTKLLCVSSYRKWLDRQQMGDAEVSALCLMISGRSEKNWLHMEWQSWSIKLGLFHQAGTRVCLCVSWSPFVHFVGIVMKAWLEKPQALKGCLMSLYSLSPAFTFASMSVLPAGLKVWIAPILCSSGWCEKEKWGAVFLPPFFLSRFSVNLITESTDFVSTCCISLFISSVKTIKIYSSNGFCKLLEAVMICFKIGTTLPSFGGKLQLQVFVEGDWELKL